MPKMIKVESSNVISIGWEKDTLYVEYKSGTYTYANVPNEVFNELLKVDSKGRFMCYQIKGKYDYTRIA